ncbi:MAG TPA: ABC transporter ATP-binding protein, partial [Kofleriaceae bacterium]
TGEAIHQLFVELNRERGSTLLIVTHNPDLAVLMPRRLRMIDGGRLIEEGPGSPSTSSPGHAVATDPPPPDAGAAP